MKEKLKLRRWVKVVISILLIVLYLSSFKPPLKANTQAKTTKDKEMVKEEEKLVTEQINGVSEVNEEIQEVEEQEKEAQENLVYEETINTNTSYTTRMTSYYPEEGETITASGLGINDFGVNNNGWFTYNGKLVVATASTRLGSTNMRTYNLYDELILNIDGIDYNAIVLDVCGACQRDNRIDLFVSSIIYAKDTNIEVRS